MSYILKYKVKNTDAVPGDYTKLEVKINHKSQPITKFGRFGVIRIFVMTT